MKFQKITITLLSLLFSVLLFAQNTAKVSPLTIGEEVVLESRVLKDSRILNVYLPYGYSEDAVTTYPVIYVLDGSMEEDFIHISGLVQFGSFSWINMLPPSIVVGIANVDRKRDFTYPSNNQLDQEEFPTSGHSEVFIQFIQEEVQPYVESRYRTTSQKTVIGQSLGGLLATEILLKHPEVFDNYIIVSPSLWWDDESLLGYKGKAYANPKAIYIAVGKEGEVMERIAKDLYETLKGTQPEHTQLYFKYFEHQDHGDTLHLAVYNAFEQLFAPKQE